MPITIRWDDQEKRIVRWDFEGAWTWREYSTAQQKSNEMMAAVDGTVDIIGNVSKSPSLPANALSFYRSSLNASAPNIGTIILVGTSGFVHQMVGLFVRMFGSKMPGTDFAFADSDDEARILLAERRARNEPEKRKGTAT